MEPVTIAIVSTAVFGVVTTISIFIRQLLLSRDKQLNDKAQARALDYETKELENMRKQMESTKRFDSHYKVLDSNKDDIQYLDQKIETLLEKKLQLINRYSVAAIKESQALIGGDSSAERKAICDRLRVEIDREIAFYDEQLKELQTRRSSFWDTHKELQEYLIEQERTRNEKLDEIYLRHTVLLEKIYVRHSTNTENVAVRSIDAGTSAFNFITAPLQMLLGYFNVTANLSPARVIDEIAGRREVGDIERDLNGYDNDDGSEADLDQYAEGYYDEEPSVDNLTHTGLAAKS
jgi:hypothetical protein